MDVLTDTKMPDRCSDASPKDPMTWGVQMPPSTHDIWEHIVWENIQMYKGYGGIQMYGCI